MRNKNYIFIFATLIIFNIGALILNLRENGVNWDSGFTFNFHYEVSIYALKVSIIAIIADWILNNWYEK
ncbi:hypothetical protein ACLSZ3_11015 [Avibacterium gallinarum]|uniref:hypothetical protein n=1 Tax=Avibacterium gallinarum TaxID=755 RepID=UPI003BF90B72